MALTLNGTTRWPNAKELRRFGETRMAGTPSKVKEILDRIDEAMSQTMSEIRSYIKRRPDFTEIGERMLQEWQKGAALSLRTAS